MPSPGSGPPETIVCVDCGGDCHLLTPAPEDGRWEVGEIVAYRCTDCHDRWDLVLEVEDVDDGAGGASGDHFPMT